MWKKLAWLVFYPVVKMAVEEVRKKLQDPKDPYPEEGEKK